MGSASSKDSAAAESTSPSSSSSGGPRALRSRVFSASCFGFPSTLLVDDPDEHKNEATAANGDARQSKMPARSSLPLVQDQERSRRSRSRFGFISDRIGERLSRTVSLRSLRARSVTSDTQSVANSEGEDLDREQALETSSHNVGSHSETEENVNMGINSSSQDIVRGNAGESSYQSDHVESEIGEDRRYNRRIGHHEPLEGSVRFSRTLSVGRLRDRVLRRTSSSTGTFGDALLQDRANEQLSEVRALGGRRRVPLSSSYEVWPDFARSYPYHDHGTDMLQLREAGNQDSVEHRSAFLDRRRRIRSQVRALQRLGSRFENLSGHERSCILSGQHRTGRCACRVSNRAGSANDNTSSRASISRIVMLAEALFEVLDEIHQQSVALSSRPSFSSIGSVPAPKEIVDCMPLKVYMRPQKQENEEAAQCYICLVEYEDGDSMRMLPCSHEFHRSCIDKWLKEIHRVCPLCRGDVCRSDTLGINKY